MPALKFFNPYAEVERHTTVLPHWEQPGATCFVTFRLADALPQKKLDDWNRVRDAWIEAHPKPWSEEAEREYHERFSSTIERWLDGCHGSCVLRDPAVARIMGDALNHFDGERCVQHAWVVMPNHVHALFTLLGGHSLEDMLHSWKSFTANQIHEITGGKGRLWQRDYFDRLIRDQVHFNNCARYIRKNPAKAKLRTGEYLLFESDLVCEKVK
ncbi:MAG: transposase [Verrucomicrobiaceae bacterium]|nr:transposase [Verrucomicrobiaceae bacterium]